MFLRNLSAVAKQARPRELTKASVLAVENGAHRVSLRLVTYKCRGCSGRGRLSAFKTVMASWYSDYAASWLVAKTKNWKNLSVPLATY